MTEELESTSQSQTCTRKRSRSLVVCCPSDPLQLSESQENHSIWEVCSGNRWDAPKTATPAASIGQQKGPDSSPRQQRLYTTQPLLHKLNELGYKVLPRLLYSPDLSQPTTTSSSIWKFFAGKTLPQLKCQSTEKWVNKMLFYFKLLEFAFYLTLFTVQNAYKINSKQ